MFVRQASPAGLFQKCVIMVSGNVTFLMTGIFQYLLVNINGAAHLAVIAGLSHEVPGNRADFNNKIETVKKLED